jgi:hypothetical protein
MTEAQVGQYIRLLCFQHQQGHLTDSMIHSVTGGRPDSAVLAKFVQDEDGLLYNIRLEEEKLKRSAYTKSRRENARARKKRLPAQEGLEGETSQHTHTAYAEHMPGRSAEHMENGDRDRNKDEIEEEDTIEGGGTAVQSSPSYPARVKESALAARFEALWGAYPRKQGKVAAFKAYQRAVKDGTTDAEIQGGIEDYIDYIGQTCVEARYVKQGGTFFSQQAWADDYGQADPQPNWYLPPFID